MLHSFKTWPDVLQPGVTGPLGLGQMIWEEISLQMFLEHLLGNETHRMDWLDSCWKSCLQELWSSSSCDVVEVDPGHRLLLSSSSSEEEWLLYKTVDAWLTRVMLYLECSTLPGV